ncbi:hypothetical protein K501DRAFT_284738 [Backusella circina FSU 941]|nr:hypothetical protein K501DRAFT_284738 [Backusella circina FSU 941]
MRLKTSLFWTSLLLVALQFQSTDAAICWFFCDSTSSNESTSASATGSGAVSSGASNSISPTLSTGLPSSSSAAPSSSSSIISSTSSTMPTSTPASSSAQPTSSSLSSTVASSSSPAPSATETSEQKDKGSSNNTGAIVGGVCGFVALIAAGFAYAFFSKTKRNKRKQYENQDIFNDAAYQSDPFNKSRPSPAMGAALVQDNASPQMQHNTQWDQQNYNNYGYTMSPQPPAAAMMNDAYYAAPPMNYGDPYYNQQQQQPSYYDMGYQQPVYEQHYQTPGMATLPPQTPAMTQNTMAAAPITSSNVYSAPHTYDDMGAPPPPPLKH